MTMGEKTLEAFKMTLPTLISLVLIAGAGFSAFAVVSDKTENNRENHREHVRLDEKWQDNSSDYMEETRRRVESLEKHELERRAEYEALRRDNERFESKLDFILQELKRLELANGNERN
jgi:predicted RNase H-like nuclease (RuvC/YqgF family)